MSWPQPRSGVFALSLILTLLSGMLAPFAASANHGALHSYIVVFNQGQADTAATARALAAANSFNLEHVYTAALQGFSARLTDQAVAVLARNPRIALIDLDRPVAASAEPLPTGVDRIDADLNAIAGIEGIDSRVDSEPGSGSRLPCRG